MTSLLDELAAIEARLEKATPGPWTREKPKSDAEGWSEGVIVANTPGRQPIYSSTPAGSYPYADADFIAAAPTDIPKLTAKLRQLVEAGEAMVTHTMAASRPAERAVRAWRAIVEGGLDG